MPSSCARHHQQTHYTQLKSAVQPIIHRREDLALSLSDVVCPEVGANAMTVPENAHKQDALHHVRFMT